MTHLAVTAVAASGILLGAMKYLLVPEDPDSPLNHPWQPSVLKAHLLAAPLLVFALGAVWRQHGLARLRSGETVGRRSGRALLVAAIPLVLSGYLVQVFVHDGARRWSGWIHAALGLAFALAFFAHPRRPARQSTGYDEAANGNGGDPVAGD